MQLCGTAAGLSDAVLYREGRWARLESALIPTPPQRLTSQHFSMRPFTPDRSRSDDLFELSRSDIAVRFGATRRELDLQTVPTLVPDNAVNRNSSEVIARF